jgi:hypothetical protein
LLKRKNKERKYVLPTVEEFLVYIPIRKDYEWTVNQEGIVQIKIAKFSGNFGKAFLRFIKKDNSFTANMDKIGSVVWINSDGKNSVKDILEILKKEFPGEKDIDQRLFLFLQQMKSLNYLDY